MGAEDEIKLDFDRGARTGAHEADGVAIAADRLIAVERPGDRFENRRLAGAVGPDDSGEAALETYLRLRVLTEVGEPETI